MFPEDANGCVCANVEVKLACLSAHSGSPLAPSVLTAQTVSQPVKLSAYGRFTAVLHTLVLMLVVGHNHLESKGDVVNILHSNQYLLS